MGYTEAMSVPYSRRARLVALKTEWLEKQKAEMEKLKAKAKSK